MAFLSDEFYVLFGGETLANSTGQIGDPAHHISHRSNVRVSKEDGFVGFNSRYSSAFGSTFGALTAERGTILGVTSFSVTELPFV